MNCCHSVLLTMALAGITFGAPGQAGNGLIQKDLFVSGTGGYHTYRIPALVATKTGALLAFCEGRKTAAGDAGDIDLLLRRSLDKGRTWSDQQIVHEEGGNARITIGNPAPVVDDATGRVHLLFSRNNQRAFYTCSDDEGLSWMPPREITTALRRFEEPWLRLGTGPGHALQMYGQQHGGRLVATVWLNSGGIGRQYRSAIIYSDDGGRQWQVGGIVGAELGNCSEATLWERADGVLVINMRLENKKSMQDPRRTGQRGVALSRDGGRTWSPPQPAEALECPGCQASVFSHQTGNPPSRSVLLFSNPADPKRRVAMTVKMSYDEGRTWPDSILLHAGPAAYSSVIVLSDGTAFCLYEAGQKRYHERLRLARFQLPKRS